MGDITSHRRDESRGQVLILIGVVVALAIIASAIALTANMQASIDHAEGVSKTTPPATSTIADVDDSLSNSIVTANRNDHAVDDMIGDQNDYISRAASHRSHEITVDVNETVDGTRLEYFTHRESLPAGVYMDSENPFSGGIELNANQVRDASGDDRTHIKTNTHEIYLNTTGDGLVRADVESEDRADTFYSAQPFPYVDLGEGSFDGYQFRSYNQNEVNNISVTNTANTEGNVELVVEGSPDAAHGSFVQDEDAVFGVSYTVTVQSDRQQTTMTRMATHGPIRGDST